MFAHSLHKHSTHNQKIMVTYKVLLDERRVKSDGTFSVIIRITSNRKASTISSGVTIKKELWNSDQNQVKPEHPSYKLLNKKITEQYLKIQKAVLELEGEDTFSIESLKERLTENYKAPLATKTICFKDFTQQLIDDMVSLNQAGNAIIYRTALNRLMVYTANTKLKFTDINYKLLVGFKNQLIKDGIKPNSISNYFRTLRAIYNKAIKANLVNRSCYPFLEVQIKTERTAKRAIAIDELVKIAKLPLNPKSQEWHARNYFLISFTLRGASFTDLAYLTAANIRKDMLTYKRRKTGKELNIKLHSITKELFSNYSVSNSKYLLPILPANITENGLTAKAIILQWVKTVNKYLDRLAKKCNIEEDVTTYVSRHTWATTAKRLGYSNELIAEALGHEYGNKITNIYLDNFDQSLIDDVNNRILSFLK